MPPYNWSINKKELPVFTQLTKFEVTNHPLRPNTISLVNSNQTFLENLTKWSTQFDEADPLLRFNQLESEKDPTFVQDSDTAINYSKIWSGRCSNILTKYTTGEKLTIVSSFLPGGEKTLIRQVSNLNEKVKHRLEQLDDFEEGSVRKTMGLSQQEFVTKINLLNNEIKNAWVSEQRVKAFKIAIQCAKLLSDVSVMQFYPSKFVLISGTLDTFGELVFTRLREKSFGPKDTTPVQEIDPDTVPETAKETCQNWIFKMASIRELLPRLYMEMSLLKCYVFLSKKDIKLTLARLTKMVRGIGNPLVAAYLRVYLCNVASKMMGKECEDFFYNNLKEITEDYQQIFHPSYVRKHEVQLLTHDRYLNLYIPALDWILFGTLTSGKYKLAVLDELLKQCEEMENGELLLYCVLSAYDSETVVQNSTRFIDVIQSCADKMVMLSDVLTSLGQHLSSAEYYKPSNPEALVQSWWNIAIHIRNANQFLQVLEPWLQFACIHLSTQHVNIILRGTIKFIINSGKSADEFSGNFHLVIKRMLKSIHDVEEIFLMDAFMPLVELVQTSNARTLMAKTVLSEFFARFNNIHIEDHVVITSLMRLCCILHDSISAVTVEDEIKVCAEVIIKYIQAVQYQDDLEKQLNFYVECRAAFIKLDAVLVALVQAVNTLSTHVDPARGRWLQRACLAYSYVTVPSLHCTLNKAHLYLLTGQVALLNNSIGQAVANFRALVVLIPDIPDFILEDGQKKPTHTKVEGILSDFLSTLLILPDSIEGTVYAYILSGFLKVMDNIHWRKGEPLYYNTMLRTLDLICALAQDSYIYHVDGVISNDKLYGSEAEFIESLETHATNICQELLVVLKMLSDGGETKKQHSLCLALFWRVIRRGRLGSPAMTSLAGNLWMLAKKLQENSTYAAALLAATRDLNDPAASALYAALTESQ